MQIKDIMSKKLITVSPDENLAVAARLLSRYNIGALPVCGKDGKLRGVITDRDIVLRCVATEDDANSVKVSEIMTRRVISVKPEESLKTASDFMAQKQIRRLPVEENGKVVGMVSLADLAKCPNYGAETADTLSEISTNIKHL